MFLQDHPTRPITLNGVTVFVNPYAEEEEKEARQKEEKEAAEADAKRKETAVAGSWWSNPAAATAAMHGDTLPAAAAGGGVGKYMKAAAPATGASIGAFKPRRPPAAVDAAPGGPTDPALAPPPAKKAKAPASGGFGNFDAW